MSDIPLPKPKKGTGSAPKKKLSAAKTAAEKALTRAKSKESQAKRRLTLARNQRLKLEKVHEVLQPDAPTTIVEDKVLEAVKRVDTVQSYAEDQENVIFRPNPGPQTRFLAAPERQVFYGGARGGGKSYAMLVDPLRYCGNGNFRGLMLRRTMPELRDLIYKSHQLYPKAYPGAKWRENEKEWRFPSGARIEFGYSETFQDALRYQGQSYTWIGVDELPQFPTPEVWNMLLSSNRSIDPTLPALMRATGNPGNVGSTWVKEMFIDPAPSETRFTVEVDFHDKDGKPRKSTITRKYIPATVWDNPYLTFDDSYVAALAALPETLRKQFLEGDWDVFEGAAFPEFDTHKHVVEPFAIPNGWVRFRACDWGYSSPACVLWFAVDWDNNLWVYRELYTKQKTADIFAHMVLQLEQGENISYGVLDSSVWAKRGDVGPSVAETMAAEGVRWRPSDRSPGSRLAGKAEVHRRLMTYKDQNGNEVPKIRIFNTCTNLIKQLKSLPLDEKDMEDVDTTVEDHAYDALRYGCMSRPLNPERSRGFARIWAPADPWLGY